MHTRVCYDMKAAYVADLVAASNAKLHSHTGCIAYLCLHKLGKR
jgi:hypothetical protein